MNLSEIHVNMVFKAQFTKHGTFYDHKTNKTFLCRNNVPDVRRTLNKGAFCIPP